MKRADLVNEATKGGPGLSGYAYQAALYCVDCGEAIVDRIAKDVAPRLSGVDDPLFSDSDTLPQPVWYEAEGICDECGEVLQ